jgi:hypothetical protein
VAFVETLLDDVELLCELNETPVEGEDDQANV